jgi:ABC-type transport system involved in multi-copper enzyme maturation permease subunit
VTPIQRVRALARAQKSQRFKLLATGFIAIVAVAFFITWLVVINAPANQPLSDQSIAQQESSTAQSTTDQPEENPGDLASTIQLSTADDLRQIIGSRDATLTVAMATATLAALAIVITWLGLGLTYVALLLAASLIVVPLLLYAPTHSLGVLTMDVVVLCAAFAASLETLRLVLYPSIPMAAVARNVLNEAVRMKIGMVFIITLILLLATMPLFLTDDSPLRYRIQSFLKYSTIATFWTLALLTLFFSCSTVAFEQRDRTIWSTVCKPITSLQYIMGKWLGIMVVNVAMISVAAAGIFFFTEFLRRQPALGEIAPFVNTDGSTVPTEDRLLLESQVLIAREARNPVSPLPDTNLLRAAIDEKFSQALERNPGANRAKLLSRSHKEVLDSYMLSTRTVEAADDKGFRQRDFTFTGLGKAKAQGKPITLRYIINSGTNSPTELYALVFLIGEVPIHKETPLNVAQTITLRPDVIQDDGTLVIGVINGDPFTGELNRFSFRFPPGEMQILYTAGGYELNFIRIFSAMLIKLGFLAAVGVFAATSMSFPVACFLTALVLFAAETAGFLNEGIAIYVQMGEKREQFVIMRKIIATVATPVAWMFTAYDNIKPGESLVQGRLLSWGTLAYGLTIIASWTLAVLIASWQVFKRRELAIYSGH